MSELLDAVNEMLKELEELIGVIELEVTEEPEVKDE